MNTEAAALVHEAHHHVLLGVVDITVGLAAEGIVLGGSTDDVATVEECLRLLSLGGVERAVSSGLILEHGFHHPVLGISFEYFDVRGRCPSS